MILTGTSIRWRHIELKQLYGAPVQIREGILLQARISDKMISILCTHGHQGDKQSDGTFFTKFFVSTIWAPLQSYLEINPNTPANNTTLKTEHNSMMYEWSSKQKDLLLITGHTHQPVFESLTYLERLQQNQAGARTVKPTYFNTGCCCFDDGDITGIEIIDGAIKLIKWEWSDGVSERVELASSSVESLVSQLD